MIYKNLELFNVAEYEVLENSYLRMYRFPKAVCNSMGMGVSSYGKYISRLTTGCEIRFVTDADLVSVSLSAFDNDGYVLVYNGDLLHSKNFLKKGKISTLNLNKPPMFATVDEKVLNSSRFSHKVWRIIFCHDFICDFCGIETYGSEIRVPNKEEVPQIKWLAYGSSITHGANALLHTHSYTTNAARRLGVDVLNKGMGGSCFCEKEVADYFSNCNEWDFITLELGVNMTGGFTPIRFEELSENLFKIIRKKNPHKHIFLITIFPNSNWYINKENGRKENTVLFNEIIRKIAQKYNDEFTHLIEGTNVLTDFTWLANDLVHPSEYGHVMMGEKIANIINKVFMFK